MPRVPPNRVNRFVTVGRSHHPNTRPVARPVIDSTDSEFTVERLREWKKQAENESMNGRMDLNNASASTGMTSIPSAARPSRAHRSIARRSRETP
jgi:hypothetical protein